MRAYDISKWLELQTKVLNERKLCEYCKARGVVSSAKVAIHLKEIKGSYDSFFDASNVITLCHSCNRERNLSPRIFELKTIPTGNRPHQLKKKTSSFGAVSCIGVNE